MARKKISQDDLRRAMGEMKKKAGVKRIESPLAKYTDSGQLTCVLCKVPVRSEAAWIVHLNSKAHKDSVASAAKILAPKEPQKVFAKPQIPKRSHSPTGNPEPAKKVKGILKNSGQSTTPTINENSSALPADFFDMPIDQKQTLIVDKTEQLSVGGNSGNGNVADNNGTEITEPEEGIVPLPEGFFDDPVLDARVRNVEYKNPIEEEWDKFQKEIREETVQSAQMIAEDQEEATNERQLDEIEEQMRNLARVIELAKKKEEFQAAERKKDIVDEEMSSDDEEDFDEFLDWREKKSYKV